VATNSVSLRQLVVESGHMIDAPDRPEMRFPPEAEARVASKIAAALDRWNVGHDTLVLTQGARGTDLLVAEAALRRGADVRVLLALPPDEFQARSVELSHSRWVERFRAVIDAADVAVQADAIGPLPKGETVFERNNRWVLDEAVAIGAKRSVPVRALVVWDGAEGDGTGGTAGFVQAAHRRGVTVEVIDPRQTWRTPNIPYWERQRRGGTKRLLALDGGGIRGVVSLKVLRRMEELLGRGKPGFVLADYFDYVAGTSTGAIIATSLALGYPVSEIEARFLRLGPEIFRKRFLPARFRSLYKDTGLTSALQDFFGADTTLGADEVRTLLLIVTHRVDTDSIWPLSNNTKAYYNDRSRDDGGNLTFPLWQLVRGSSAAPVFFLPEVIDVGAAGSPKQARFEDGGVTPFNNPALLLFEMATSPRYRLGWEAGAERLLLVSVGTGTAPAVDESLVHRKTNLIRQATNVVRVIMNGSSVENDRLCRVLGHCRHGEPIDSEFDAEDVTGASPDAPLFSYVRYSIDISAAGLRNAGLGDIDARRVARLDSVGAVAELGRIGQRAAEQVELHHFARFDPEPSDV
jgi:hypothetical protein